MVDIELKNRCPESKRKIRRRGRVSARVAHTIKAASHEGRTWANRTGDLPSGAPVAHRRLARAAIAAASKRRKALASHGIAAALARQHSGAGR
jgi:hypothetical protein